MPGIVRVENLHDIQVGFAKLDKELRLGFRGDLRQIAEPIQKGAEELAMSEIKRMSRSPRWSKMRVGITRDFVYVAPRQRGIKTRGPDPRRRPHKDDGRGFPDLLMDRAMEPALERHASEVEARVGELLDRTLDQFNHGA